MKKKDYHPFSKPLKSRCQKISRIRRQIKKIDFFYITKKTLLVNYFKKQMNIQKFQRSSVFEKNHKLHGVNPGSVSGRFFLSAHCRCVRCFCGQCAYAGIFSYPICTSRIYSVYMYIFFKITQPLTPPPLHSPQKWSARQTVENMRTLLPLSRNICFTFQSLVIFSGQMHVICIRNFVTYTGLMKTSIKVTYTDNSRTLSNEIL